MQAKGINEREIILDILLEVEKGEYLAPLIRAVFEKYAYLPKRSRSFIKLVCEGTLERQYTLDYLIDQVSKVKSKKLKPLIRQLLRMSLYQLKFMDSPPSRAIINEAVALAKKRHFNNLAGFVNAVLRRLDERPALREEDYPDMWTAYSVPEFVAELLKDKYGEEAARNCLRASLLPPRVFGRVNERLTDRESLIERLKTEGALAEAAEGFEDAIELKSYDRIFELESFREGLFTVQDLSSQLVGLVGAALAGERVLDICSAPGGKAIHIAQLARESQVLACDKSEKKKQLIDENIRRCRCENINSCVRDALEFVPEEENAYSLVLADLPCSGLGVMSRKADIRYRLKKEDIHKLALLQRQILDNAVRYVKPGGVLIYSTCTLTREENEEQYEYLTGTKGLKPVDFEELLPGSFKGLGAKEGSLQLLNGRDGTDGFYIACFRRES